MNPDQFQLAEFLLGAVRDVEPEERAEWLDENCDDPEVRAEVIALLEHDEAPHDLLDEPAFRLGELITSEEVDRAVDERRKVRKGPEEPSPFGRLAVLGVLMVILLATGAVAWTMFVAPRAPTIEPPPTISEEAWATGIDGLERAAEFLRRNDAAAARDALDKVPADVRGWTWSMLRSRCDRTSKVLPGNEGPVRLLTWSPDQKTLATAEDAGIVRLLDVSGGPVRTLGARGDVAQSGISALEFSPHGARLASADGRRGRIWDAATGTLIDTWTAAAGIRDIAWDPAGRWLALGRDDGVIELRPLADGEGAELNHGAPVVDIAFSEGGQRLASVGENDRVRIWDPEPRFALGAWRVDGVATLAVSSDSGMVAAGTNDGTIVVRDFDGTIRRWPAHHDAVTGLDFDPSGTRLISVSADRMVAVWDPGSGEQLSSLPGHTDPIRCVAAGDVFIASGDGGGAVRLWPWVGSIEAISAGSDAITATAARSSSVAVAVDPKTGPEIRVFDIERGVLIDRVPAEATVSAVTLGAGDAVMFASGETVSIRMPTSPSAGGSTAPTIAAADINVGAAVTAIAAHPTALRAVVALGDQGVRAVDFETGEVRESRVPAHRLDVSADGALIAAISADGRFTLQNAETLEVEHEVLVPSFDAKLVATPCFDSDGTLLVTGHEGLAAWQIGATTPFVSHDEPRLVGAAALRGTNRIAIADYRGTVRIVDLWSGRTMLTLLKGGRTKVRGFAVAREGRTVIAVLDDGTIRMWSSP